MAHEEGAILRLPIAVISPVDVGRLERELTALDEFLSQSTIRKPGEPMSLPRTSRLLEQLAQDNTLNLLTEADRKHLLQFLMELKSIAPKVHISFAVDPSPAFLRKLISWLRREIHPLVLLTVGLQPGIAAGCIVRTPDKYFDFSLRQHLLDKRDILIERIGAAQ